MLCRHEQKNGRRRNDERSQLEIVTIFINLHLAAKSLHSAVSILKFRIREEILEFVDLPEVELTYSEGIVPYRIHFKDKLREHLDELVDIDCVFQTAFSNHILKEIAPVY